MTPGRKNIMLGTAGHVDHGKTALVKMLTGCDTDTLAEEKQRGLTIDIGFAPCRLRDQRIVGVVDVPGHVDFIRNMVAGAHGIDVVILVVAADDGVMPQTHEHLHILSLMGLRHGLVALTKIDLVEPARRPEVIEDVRRLLTGTFLERAPICPVSNVTFEGYDAFLDVLHETVAACEGRPCTGLFRVWVEDVFTVHGFGTVATGIPTTGRLRTGDHLELLPGNFAGRVRKLEVYGEEAAEGRAGECVAINLSELSHEHARRGMVLTEPGAIQPVSMAEADVHLLAAVQGRLKDYAEVQVHAGTASVQARVALLETGELLPGQRQAAQLRFASPLALVPGDRFVIRANVAAADRSGLTTVGGGRILSTSNVRLRRQRPWSLALLGARRDALDDAAAWCELMLREQVAPMTSAQLAHTCFRRPDELHPLLDVLRSQGCLAETPGGALVHRSAVGQAAARLRSALTEFHQANPQSQGATQEVLFGLTAGDPALLQLATADLLGSRQVTLAEGLYALAGWMPRLPEADQRLCDEIADALRKARWTPPSLGELAQSLNLPLPRVAAMARLLIERGLAARLDEHLLMHQDAVEAARQVALRLFARAPSFSTMDFRDALGVSRKYAVPLLDFLDACRFTVRNGHQRTAGVEARKRMSKP